MSLLLRTVIVAVAVIYTGEAYAQALPTASGPGSYVALGGGLCMFQAQYGRQDIGGGFVYADVHPHWRYGLEGEARFLRWHTSQQIKESNYIGGLRVMVFHPGRFNPYAKFLAGVGTVTLTDSYAHGSFLAYAPGAGLDIALSDRVTVRAVDLEYQHWPQFTYGPLNPYGLSGGISIRLNSLSRLPRGKWERGRQD